MRHLKEFNESTETPKVSLREFMNGQGIYRWVENPDGSIDFPGDLVMSQYTFDELDFRLESIQGSLTLSGKKITSLIGSPRYVRGSVSLRWMSQLTSLEGGPEEVGGNFSCRETSISNLIGAPQRVGYFDAAETPITSLEGLPRIVEETIYFDGCRKLWNPEGLRDCQIGKVVGLEFGNTPLGQLVQIFGNLKTFQESLDYNYIRGTTRSPAIDLFRFKEALKEFDIDLGTFMKAPQLYPQVKLTQEKLGKYIFLNESGDRIDLWGNIIEFFK